MMILEMMMLAAFLWIGIVLTGALLSAVFWLLIRVPVALALILTGIAMCCTLILIPVGRLLMRAGTAVLIP